MLTTKSLAREVTGELRRYLQPPRIMINSLTLNSAISILFFLGSFWLGTYNPELLPIAAATILFWTLADTSVCNQFVFDRARATRALQADGTLRHFLLVKNISIAILSIPLTVLYGLLLVAILGKWSEIIYGVVVAITLVWGWLGISNALSALLPFELLSITGYAKNRSVWLSYGFLYALPWILLPAYAVLMSLPFILLGWTKTSAVMEHRFLATAMLLTLSLVIWFIGLKVADAYTTRPNSRVKRLLKS